ncbi:hypothetical protein I4U23_008457 [Adineta vaga]|nr:hypothetical protein I4U23_008457 [Adineta vaga]
MKIRIYYILYIIITCLTILHIIVNLYIYRKFSSLYSLKRQSLYIIIGCNVHSDTVLIESSKSSIKSTICIDLLLNDEKENIKYSSQYDIQTIYQPLFVIVLDEENKPVTNITVHIKLFDYSSITFAHYTNDFGEVNFHHLSRDLHGFIEAICPLSKRYASIEIKDTYHVENITLVLKELSSIDYEEYDPMDRGYYAI